MVGPPSEPARKAVGSPNTRKRATIREGMVEFKDCVSHVALLAKLSVFITEVTGLRSQGSRRRGDRASENSTLHLALCTPWLISSFFIYLIIVFFSKQP